MFGFGLGAVHVRRDFFFFLVDFMNMNACVARDEGDTS